MAILDIVIIAVGLFFIVRGYLHGFVRGVASLGGLVLAVAVGIRYQPYAQKMLDEAFGPSLSNFFVAFFVLFLVTLILVALLGLVIMKLISVSPLGNLDKVLGLLVGAVKAWLVTMLGVFLLVSVAGSDHTLVAQSKVAPYAISAAGWTLGHLPEGISIALSRAKKAWERNAPLVKPQTKPNKDSQ